MQVNLRKVKAFTLVELLLVVGVISLGSVVAYITLPKVQATTRANREATNINTITAGVKNLYTGLNSYSSLGANDNSGNQILINAKAVPDNMIEIYPDGAITGNLINGFGGQVKVTADMIGTISVFKLRYDGVPDAECNKLASGVGNNFLLVGITPEAGLVTSNTVAKPFNSSTPIDVSLVSDLCTNNNSNQLLFYSK